MPDPVHLGTISRDRDRWALKYVRDLGHPAERVWRALTESEQLRHWFPSDLVGEREEGATLSLPFWTEHLALYEERYEIETPELSGVIRVWQPFTRFEWNWDVDVLEFLLVPTTSGTTLTFTTWLGLLSAEPEHDPAPLADTAAGYHVCLDELTAVLDRGKQGPIPDDAAAKLTPLYAALIPASW